MTPARKHEEASPSPGEKFTAKTTPEPNAKAAGPQLGIEPAAAPTPPGGWTATRTITITVYTPPSGYAPPMYYVVEGSYNAFHGSANNVHQDILNRLSPPPAASGAG